MPAVPPLAPLPPGLPPEEYEKDLEAIRSRIRKTTTRRWIACAALCPIVFFIVYELLKKWVEA